MWNVFNIISISIKIYRGRAALRNASRGRDVTKNTFKPTEFATRKSDRAACPNARLGLVVLSFGARACVYPSLWSSVGSCCHMDVEGQNSA